ncbi:MAG: phosphate ABC transporter substrate-binding protein [bacterium]|nr:phosphate ABC transporter substrate-binding protein [bacterium]
MRKFYCDIFVLLSLLFTVSTVSVAEDYSGVYTTGSSTVAPLVAELARLYEEKKSDVRIEVETGGSSRGVADTLSGVVDFGMVSRSLKPEEISLGLQEVTIAYDGIALIVHRTNPVAELTFDQIRAIYTGKITNWKEVGGDDSQIVVVNKAQGRSTLELFLEHFALSPQDIKPSSIIGDNQQGIKLVSGNAQAIGYVSIGAAEYEAKRGGSLKLLPLEGIEANIANVKNRKYPLVRPLNLVMKGALRNDAKAFVDFITSNQASETVSKLYFVPLHE